MRIIALTIIIILLLIISFLISAKSGGSSLPPIQENESDAYLKSSYTLKEEAEKPVEEKSALINPEELELRRSAISDCLAAGVCKGK